MGTVIAMTRNTLLAVIASSTLIFGALGCGDDENSSASGGNGGAGASGGSGGTGAAGGGETGGGGTGGAGANMGEYAVLVRGELFTADLTAAQDYHDTLAAQGEQPAKDAGDFGHDALLGTTLLGTTENAFLGLDRWDNLAGLEAFYADPMFVQAFGMLFSAPPAVETFQYQPEWHNWGDLTSGDSAPQYFFVVVRGHLVEADPAAAQMAHDAVAAGGEATAAMLGDMAHVVFTGVQDPQEFLAIDIWHDSTNIETLYTDPDFVMAFASLFDAPPTIGVYQSTNWHQW